MRDWHPDFKYFVLTKVALNLLLCLCKVWVLVVVLGLCNSRALIMVPWELYSVLGAAGGRL